MVRRLNGKSSGSTRSRARGLDRDEAHELAALGRRPECVAGKHVDPAPPSTPPAAVRVAPDREQVARLVADVDAPVDVAVRVPLAPDDGEVQRPDRIVARRRAPRSDSRGHPAAAASGTPRSRLVRAVQEVSAVEEVVQEDPLRPGRSYAISPPSGVAASSRSNSSASGAEIAGRRMRSSPTGFSRLRSSQDSKRLKNAGESAVRAARARAARAGRAAPNRRCRTSRTARRTRWSR